MIITFYDLETTGLPNKANPPGIIQIAAIKYVIDDFGPRCLAEFDERCDPEIPPEKWEAGAMRVTGIGPKDVEGHTTLFEILPRFAQFMTGTDILSGYNICGFDDDILYENLLRFGYEKNFPWPPERYDVMDWAKVHHGQHNRFGIKAPKLGELYRICFDEPMENAHDALADVRATSRIYLEKTRG